MLVIVAPGQGAQTPGFLTPWLEIPTFRSRFEGLAATAELDLVHYGTEADADAIRDTQIAQPLLVATGLATALELLPESTGFAGVGAVAGHSVGELTAAGAVGAFSGEQAMVLVRERGKAMAEASAVTPTGMTAVLGGDRDEVLATLDKHGLTPANDNGPGQIVAAGTLDSCGVRRRAARQGPADPAQRRRRLSHRAHGSRRRSPHGAGGVRHHGHPATAVISNRDGQVVRDGGEVLTRIVGQIANPVRWDLCMGTMLELGVTGMLELPPAGTLSGIAKRAMKGVETFALKTPDQLDDARAFVERHGEASANPSSSNPEGVS